MATVAAVLDGYGGWYTVVGKHQVRPGQIKVTVPHFQADDPPPFNDIPKIIFRAELALLEWIGQRNDRSDPAIALFLLRRKRGFHRESVNLCEIVET